MIPRRVIGVALVVAAGLALRRFGYDLVLPFVAVKYGGSALWGAMVFLLVATLTRSTRIVMVAAAALGITVCVELSRLYQTPEFDAFRLTTAGKLLLGRVFSLWNILAYAVGIGLAAVSEAAVLRSLHVTPERGSAA